MPVRQQSSLYSWFIRDLKALIPEWFSAMFLGRAIAPKLLFDPNVSKIKTRGQTIVAPVRLVSQNMPAESVGKPRIVDTVLPEVFFLKRTVEAQAGAVKSLPQIAELDLIRRTPFQPNDVYWVLSPPHQMDNKVTVSQWVASKTDIDALRQRLKKHGLHIRQVYIENQQDVGPVVELSGAQSTKIWRRLNIGLGLVAASFAIFLWLFPGWKARQNITQIETQLNTLRSEALALRAELEALRERENERSEFIKSITHRPLMSQMLRELTVSAPDTAWISEFTFRNDTIALAGETSESAAALVLLLSEAKAFSDPRLSGPVSRTVEGKERFELTLSPRVKE